MLIYCFDWDKVKVCRRKESHVFREFASVFASVLHAVKCTKNMIFFSLTKFDLLPIKTIDKHQKCQQKYQLLIRYRFCELRMRPSAVLLPACVCLTIVWLRDAICTDSQLLTIAATAAPAISAFAANSLARYIPIPQDSRQDHLNRRNEGAVYEMMHHFDQIRRQRDLRLDPSLMVLLQYWNSSKLASASLCHEVKFKNLYFKFWIELRTGS